MSNTARFNLAVANAIVEELTLCGVHEACISPGSRSTPLVLATANNEALRDWVITDERSAAFFALGAARQSGSPVMLVCTSGTAAANYLPAVVEANLSSVPLIVVTADRPPELRDRCAPQTIDQVHLYGSHVKWAVDVPCPSDGEPSEAYYRALACRAVAVATDWPAGPVHLNVPFREPLIERQPASASLANNQPKPRTVVYPTVPSVGPEAVDDFIGATARLERGIIVCGPRSQVDASLVCELASRLGWPLLADPLSGLRFGSHELTSIVDAYDLLLRDERFRKSHEPEVILQIGAPPVSKALGSFMEMSRVQMHAVVAPPAIWPDPSNGATHMIRATASGFCGAVLERLPTHQRDGAWVEGWVDASRTVRHHIDASLSEETSLYEAKVITELVSMLPERATLHVGNSMPVRDLDTYLCSSARRLSVDCNRGANGIDGVLSTGLGAAAVSDEPLALVLGDLSFLHDIGGLQIAARYSIKATIVVVDNDGGGVFSFLPQAQLGTLFEPYFATPHGLRIEGLVEPCNAKLHTVGSWTEFATAVEASLSNEGADVIVVPSDRAENRRLHEQFAMAAAERVSALS